jgi:adapter protein MecA 1/2
VKIERISDNQIRCTLSKHDLVERQLKIGELAYGSEKARELFRDMMEQANIDLGFEVDDIPLMIEAIPTSRDSIVLVVTKVDNPDEFEERFARFGIQAEESDSDFEDYDYDEDEAEGEDVLTSNDIANCFEQLHELMAEAESNRDSSSDDSAEFIPLSEALKAGTRKKNPDKKKKAEFAPDKMKVFSFISLNPIIHVAHSVTDSYTGKNSVWKNVENGRYYLLLNRGNAKNSFRSVCSMIGEFGKEEPVTYATQDYFNEHYQIIIKDKALTQLSKL